MNAPTRFQQSWPPDLDAILIAGRAGNKTCAEIAALVGRTENSVIGRLHRLRIDGKIEGKVQNAGWVQKPRADGHADWVEAKRAKRQYAADQSRAMRILRAMDAPPPIVGPAAPVYAERFQEGYQGQQGRVSIADLTAETCRFPIDMPKGPVWYCGDAVRRGSAYCEDHAARCSTAPAPRRLGRWGFI